jgi:hypothetical protein
MYANDSMWTGRPGWMPAACCACLFVVVLVLGPAGCTADSDRVLLPASQSTSDRIPAAGLCQVTVVNDAEYPAVVAVDYYIGQTVVHHAEAVLAAAGSTDINTDLVVAWDEADRVVISARVDDSQGEPIWSDETNFPLGADSGDVIEIEYRVHLSAANQAPTAVITATTPVYEGNTVSLSGSSSSDPDGDPLTYTWEQISGTTVTLTGADQPDASFIAPSVAVSDTLIFRLTVSDGFLSDTQEWSVVVLAAY